MIMVMAELEPAKTGSVVTPEQLRLQVDHIFERMRQLGVRGRVMAIEAGLLDSRYMSAANIDAGNSEQSIRLEG